MEYETTHKKFICVNCGKIGHEIKFCSEPVTSFGIINIKILDNTNEGLILKNKFSTNKNTFHKIISKKYSNVKCYISDSIKLYEDRLYTYKMDDDYIPYQEDEQFKKFCYYKNKILFMMVSRKFSLGFIEFLRGKYDVSNTRSIINLFEQMYDEEVNMIKTYQYDILLYNFLNRHNEQPEIVLNRIYEGKYSNEYCEAKIKFNMLSNAKEEDEVPCGLSFYTKHIKPRWKKPEWGFPKGRREKRTEENLACACREFEEETGFNKSEYSVLNKIEPIEERLVGTNGVGYKHIYYLAINESDKECVFENYDSYEIGQIRWFTYDDAMSYIRPYHIEKKRALTRVFLFILNYLIYNSLDI